MLSNDIWYFAYGSNLNYKQREIRMGNILEFKKVKLKGYKLTFAKRKFNSLDGRADILKTENPQDVVYGVVYKIKPSDLTKMDPHEGVKNKYYQRTNVVVEDLSDLNEKINAISYEIVEKLEFIKPPIDYLNKILIGLKEHSFDNEIIENVKNIANMGDHNEI